jgi:hypothetical protein
LVDQRPRPSTHLGKGIHGEVTLTYQRGRFRPWA